MRYIIKTNNMGVVVSAFEMQKIAMTRNLPDDTIEVYEDYPEVENAIVVDSDAAPYIGYSTYINDVFNLNADAYTAGVASARAKADRLSEMRGIQSWFDSYYMQHEQKYNRLIALGQLCDDWVDPQVKLTALYKEAEEKRKRYQELENAATA